MKKTVKILVVAYACEPNKGSEQGIGWNLVKQIAKYTEIWVITRKNNKSPIDDALLIEPIPNLHMIYYDLPMYLRFWKRGSKGIYLYYLLWELGVTILGHKLDTLYKFDLIHHLTFANYWMPPFMGLLKKKFIWGPTGIHPYIPRDFHRDLHGKERILNSLRHFILKTSKVNPFINIALLNTDRFIAINEITEMAIPEKFNGKVVRMHAVGANVLSFVDKINGNQIFKVVYMGRYVSLKGVHLALEAFKLFHNRYNKSILVIIGAGPEEMRLKEFISNNNLEGAVTLQGWLNHSEVLQKMHEFDALLFPSFEGGGMVVVEALSTATPVVCLDFGGPGEFVDDNSGIKVPVTNRQEVISRLSDALIRLATDNKLLKHLSEGAIAKVNQEYIWDVKGHKIKRIYEDVLGYRF